MNDPMEMIFLGTGTSHGIPMIGCDCAVCKSDDPRDRRHRCSVAIRCADGPDDPGRTLLIDTPPELRVSAIAHDVRRVDAVLVTHAHADHVLGMDDLRRYNSILGRTISCYGNAEAIDTLRTIFRYTERPYGHPDLPSLSFNVMAGPTVICGRLVIPVPLLHGRREILGFRIGPLAYCTDCSAIPEASYPLLEGLDLLVLGAVRHRPHPTHFNFTQALAAIERIERRRALLTHIAHDTGHAHLDDELPASVAPAHDGLRVQVGS